MIDTRPPRPRRWPVIAPLVGGLALVAAACAPPSPPPPPPPPCTPVVLEEGHVNGPGIAFEDGEWDLHIHDEETDTEYEPDCAVLKAKDEAETTVPADPAFGFLGAVGDPVWVLPQVQDPELLYLGYASEEIAAGDFEGDVIDFSLVDVDGPGEFIVYSVDGFGIPTVLFDSGNPLPQTLTIPTGNHTHVNWAFTAPGEYTISYEVTGTPTGGSPVSSGPVEYSYQVGG